MNHRRPLRVFSVLALLTIATLIGHAEPPSRLASKLDALLAARVRSGDEGPQRVIIRTTPDGVPGLATALAASGNDLLRVHPLINAATAFVKIPQLEALARLPFVVTISSDAVVVAEQTSSTDSTLRGTLGLPGQLPTGNRVGVALIDSGLGAGT